MHRSEVNKSTTCRRDRAQHLGGLVANFQVSRTTSPADLGAIASKMRSKQDIPAKAAPRARANGNAALAQVEWKDF